jgi:flagellar motor switch protein FliM
MKKVLRQEEINNLIRNAQSPAEVADPSAQSPRVTLWDGRLAGRIGEEHLQAINRLHEAFASNLTYSLGAYLRAQIEIKQVSGEHLTYGEFLQSIPDVTYLVYCKLAPLDNLAVLQLDLAVAFPLIDVLLGGEGKGEAPSRGITEIEEQILETVIRMICRELQNAWQALSLKFQFERRQHREQMEQLMPGSEKILLLSFEITLLESRGTLNLVVPALVSNALLRKIAERRAAKPRLRPESENRLRARLLNCPFEVELTMPSLVLPLRALVGLAPGALLRLGRSTQHPASLFVAGREMFSAAAAHRGSMRAAQVLSRIPTQNPTGKGNA